MASLLSVAWSLRGAYGYSPNFDGFSLLETEVVMTASTQHDSRHRRARRVQLAILIVEALVVALVATLTGVLLRSVVWAFVGAISAAVLFVVVGSIAFVMLGGMKWFRARK